MIPRNEHLSMEFEGATSPAQSAEAQEIAALEAMIEDSGIRKLETLLDSGATAEVLRMTPEMWREKNVHERRALLNWTEQRIKVFSEKYAFMLRNVGPEVAVPDYLREGAA